MATSTTRPTSRLAVLSAGLLATATLSACGSDDDGGGEEFADQSVAEIKEQVIADMKSAKSLTMDGSFTNDGEETGLKLTADTEGNCTGTLTLAGGTADFIRAEGGTFIKGDETFWRANAGAQADQVLALLGDKWAKLPTGQDQFAEFCDLDNFIDEFDDADDTDNAKAEKGEVEEIDGQEALEITSAEDGGTSRAWVATEGKHYFLRLESDGDEPGEFTFTDYDEPVDAEAPAEGEFVDLSQAG